MYAKLALNLKKFDMFQKHYEHHVGKEFISMCNIFIQFIRIYVTEKQSKLANFTEVKFFYYRKKDVISFILSPETDMKNRN